jgi:hypothetical protein
LSESSPADFVAAVSRRRDSLDHEDMVATSIYDLSQWQNRDFFGDLV